eukprot:2350468-Alexandrium_andersonii.AAC.1
MSVILGSILAQSPENAIGSCVMESILVPRAIDSARACPCRGSWAAQPPEHGKRLQELGA